MDCAAADSTLDMENELTKIDSVKNKFNQSPEIYDNLKNYLEDIKSKFNDYESQIVKLIDLCEDNNKLEG